MDTLEEIDATLDERCGSDANLQHLRYMFEGYRKRIWGEHHDRVYSPGSAKDVSYKMGVELAKKDANAFLWGGLLWK